MSESTSPELEPGTREKISSNLVPELSNLGVATNWQSPAVLCPRLVCTVSLYPEQIILTQNGRDLAFTVNRQSGERLQKLFSMMDGTRSLSELQQIFSPHQPEVINGIICQLDEQGFIDEGSPLPLHSGVDTLQELAELTQEWLAGSTAKNWFRKLSQSTASDVPVTVLYGWAIAYYHILSRKGEFYSSLLSYQGSTKISKFVNELYFQQYGQGEFLVKALNAIGISDEALAELMPLPETMAICNGLTYWASFDPLFVLSILGLLTSQTCQDFQSYRQTCERIELDSGFLKSIRQLTNSKLNSELDNLSRRIVQEIPPIDPGTKQRFRGQLYLLIEMYNNFHQAIWNHYSSTNPLGRRVSAI